MKNTTIDLTELVTPGKTNSISGRAFGEKHALDVRLSERILKGEVITITFNSDLVKAINDSFIKGFFSKLFEKYVSADQVKQFVKLEMDENFVKLFEKNWILLEAIYSH